MIGDFGPYRIEPATVPFPASFTAEGSLDYDGETVGYVFAEAEGRVFLTVRVRRLPMSFRLFDQAYQPLTATPADADDLGADVAAHVAEHVQATGELPSPRLHAVA
jgi:hypothetical protein